MPTTVKVPGPAAHVPELARQNARLLAAIRIQQEIAQPGIDGLEIMHRIAEQVRALLHADLAAVAVPVSSEMLEYTVVVGDVFVEAPLTLPMTDSLAGWCYVHRESSRCGDTLRDQRVSKPVQLQLGMRSSLVVPLTFRDDCLGVLTASSRAVDFFDDDDHRTLELLAGILAAALANAEVCCERQRLLTDRTAALESLRSREEMFRALTENADELLSVLDENGVIRFASESATRVLGFDPEELIGRQPAELVHPDDHPRLAETMASLLEPNGTADLMVRIRHKDGGWRYVEGTGRNLMHVPAVRGIVTNARDVTVRRLLEEQLLQSQKMDAVGQLAGGVAHDFNNILTAITSYSDMLLMDLEPAHPARSDVTEIRTAARRAADLTRQLLAFSRKQVMELDVFDATAVVRQMDNLLGRLIGENIVLETRYPDTPLPIRADRVHLEQVIMNLAVNSRDAMPAGGRLRISLDRADITQRAGSDLAAGTYVRLRVADDGCGMSDETKGRVFEPFFTTKPHGAGTGLGLSVVYGIIKQFGAAIEVASELGAGTEFTIYFPLATARPRTTHGIPEQIREGSETILLVEDNDAVAVVARRVLQRSGYRVLLAGSGSEALDLVARQHDPIDLVLTDVVMPEMSGPELAERLAGEGLDVPIVFMSGYAENTVLRRERLSDGALYLEKPWTPTSLNRTVRAALDRRSPKSA